MSEELVLPVIGKRLFFDRGCSAELDEYVGVVEVIGRQFHTHVLVYDVLDVVLIGLTVLEILSFEVDPVTGKLRKGKIYLPIGLDSWGPAIVIVGLLVPV
ncbi:hypothetical protein N186_08100 [Thermofilum adornatum]|uniref:Uncharacterized protein n=1 Tax=Thermofilum adornatum TaxID=1365176 RepID=S5ZFM4_9CREN|nr:hypothetical protein [Thermofilum adornatum]AGT35958.1 hypothetical protein N186_08100 [Thermofilum adornatum]